MALSGPVLWLHVLCGVTWIGAAASCLLAMAAMGGPSRELGDFTLRVAPRLNRLCLACATLIPITGVANLGFSARARGFRLPAAFIEVVGVKLGLFLLMVTILWRVSERIAALAGKFPAETWTPDDSFELGSLMRLYGLMVATGSAALLMGLWLAGIA